MILSSYAKVNLFLSIKGRRPDGYHTLETVFERVDLCDEITLLSRTDGDIRLKADSPQVPLDNTNLAWRAAELLRSRYGVKRGVDIRIRKRIPVGAGLGGGSSNAASALTGLNRLWKLKLSRSSLIALGASLGADVPFFLYDTPYMRAGGRGDILQPLKVLGGLQFWHVLVAPLHSVSTALAYQKWDEIAQKVRLTKPAGSVTLLLSAIRTNDSAAIGTYCFNSLEQASVALYPRILRIKEILCLCGARWSLMSGSGPAVFTITDSYEEAMALARRLASTKGIRVFVTRTRSSVR